MRKLLFLAFLLYDIISIAISANNYDYEDLDGIKRHSLLDDRRNWRKKVLMGPGDLDHKDDLRKRQHDFESPIFVDEQEPSSFRGNERRHDLAAYKKRYEVLDKAMKSGELIDEKKSTAMNCDRQHERYESCFAGCAAISCDNPRDRLRPCYPFCEPGCICVPPYVRDDRTHKCILPDECSKGLKGIPDLGDDA